MGVRETPTERQTTNIGLNRIKFNFINEICLMAMVPYGDVGFLILGECKSPDSTRDGS